jgi:hypothetical protein
MPSAQEIIPKDDRQCYRMISGAQCLKIKRIKAKAVVLIHRGEIFYTSLYFLLAWPLQIIVGPERNGCQK